MGGRLTCTVNPGTGREREWSDSALPDIVPQRVLVVGGGPGGLKLADGAAARGHEVVLVEAADELGGALRFAGRVPHRSRWLHLVEDLTYSLEQRGVDLRLGTEATADLVRSHDADVTVFATGSVFDKTGFSVLRPDRAGIPGASESSVLSPVDAIVDIDRVGDRVVVVDDFGDHAAMGVAELLADAGREVHIVTMGLFVGSNAVLSNEVPSVRYPQLAGKGVRLMPNTTVQSIAHGRVEVLDVWSHEAQVIEADTVVLNMLRKTESGLYRTLRGEGRDVVRIGDCLAPRQVDDAMFEATDLALRIGTETRNAARQPIAS